MTKFRIHFAHGETIDVQAFSAESARKAGEQFAAQRQTFVLRVKRVRS